MCGWLLNEGKIDTQPSIKENVSRAAVALTLVECSRRQGVNEWRVARRSIVPACSARRYVEQQHGQCSVMGGNTGASLSSLVGNTQCLARLSGGDTYLKVSVVQ